MTTRIVHCKKDSYDTYIGRPTEWGNPFSHKDGTLALFKAASRDEAVEKYREWINHPDQAALKAKAKDLKGKTLACWCKPLSCHGDVLVDIAEGP